MSMDKYVWIRPQRGYSEVPIGAYVLAAFGARIKVKDDDNNELWISPQDILRPMHPTSVFGVDDMITLGDLQEYSILRNLKLRYTKDIIYTYVGSILVAVNPYKVLPIYGKSKMLEYRRKGLGELPPHVYALADSSFENMRKNQEKRCIVISGESGAGKTESTKLFLKYFAHISNKQSGKEEQILDSNPILEAFGNAVTIRNDNSSRFGKFIAINFNSDGSIHSAKIKQYLLEKSRIVSQSQGEKNYHIFYSMLSGTLAEEKQRLELKEVTSYNYLNTTINSLHNNTQKSYNLENVKSAMKVLNFTDSDIWHIFEILSAILHLGNIEYKTMSVSNIESVEINSSSEVHSICRLLGVSKNQLVETLTKKTISTHGDNVAKLFSKQQAIDSRDAFAKRIYGNLFNFIVGKINENLQEGEDPPHWFIGVLDIFGFEVFDRNSFEQLCINYANEKLQQFFIAHIFKIEQQQYAMEGINWKYVEYTDNAEILHLIEVGPMSILSVIDDESKFPRANDQTMLDKLVKFHSNNEYFFKPKYKHISVFGIKHFAGAVLYDVQNFLEKNHDACSLDMKKAVQSSKNSFLKEIFSEDFEADSKANFRKRTETLAFKFKNSLDLLMSELSQCHPFFVRCIKPNEMKKAHKFDRELCCKQLRCSGMTETTKIREAGYALRYDYVQFVQRYRVMCPGTPLAHKTDCKEATKRICKIAFKNFPRADYQLGHTKIFLKHQEELFIEKERERALYDYVVTIQKMVRGWLERRRHLKLKNAVLLVENNWSGKQNNENSKKGNLDIDLHRNIAVRLQAYCRGFLVRKLFKRKLEQKKLKNQMENSLEKNPSFTFQKFAQKYFQLKRSHKFSKKSIKSSLTRLLQPDDVAAAKALWLTILRYMGNVKPPKKSSGKISAIAQMRKIFERVKENEESLAPADRKGLKKNEKANHLYQSWLKTQSDDLDKIHFVVAHGIARSELRDEIYSQICKALTKNPSEKAVGRGWDLLASCIGCFPPSDLFLVYLKTFIREGPNKYKSYCLFRLHRTLQNGPRTQPPCHTEFQAIVHQKYVVLEVFLMNGAKTLAKIDSSTTAREMLDAVAKKVRLTDNFGFSIAITHEMKHLSLGDGADFVLDAISECEQYAREIGDALKTVPWKLYLKKEMFAPWHVFTTDDVSSMLICHQIIEGVKAGEYECQAKDLTRLVPQLCYADRATLNSFPLRPSFDEYLPHYFQDEFKYLKKQMKIIYRQMFEKNQRPVEAIRDDIMEFAMKTWPLQFSRVFNVIGSVRNINGFFSYPEIPLLVAVNHTGIFVIDESNEKRTIVEMAFMEIKEITRKEVAEGKGYILKITSHMGVELSLVFKSSSDSSLHELFVKITETLKKFSKYVVAVKDYETLDKSFLEIQTGDLIILSQKYQGVDLMKNFWAEGLNTRSGKMGNFLLEVVEIIPTIEKPPQSLVVAMTEGFLPGKKTQTYQRVERLKHYTLESYAAKHFAGRQGTEGAKDEGNKNNRPELWRYSRGKIRSPLHVKLSVDENLSTTAVETFEAILRYIEDKYNGSLESDVQTTNKIFNAVLQNEKLRDEVYCQIMKQLTLNPDQDGENRVWELMWMITGLVPCQNKLATEVKKFLQSRRTMQTARECLPRFYKISRSDSRKCPPHMIEIQAVKQRPCQILYKIYFPDDSHKFFQINSLTKAGDLTQVILNRLRITSSKNSFNLFVAVAGRLFSFPHNCYIFDYFQLLKKWIEKDNVSTPNWQHQIYFMKETWKDSVPGQDKFIDLTFLFPQEYNKYIQGYYELSLDDILQLAAFLFKVYSVNGKSCQQILHKLIPSKFSFLKKPQAWVKDITKIHSSLSPEEGGKIEFLKYLQKFPFYGLQYFWVKSEKSNLTNYILYPKSAHSSSDI